jgi:hypothetical protein
MFDEGTCGCRVRHDVRKMNLTTVEGKRDGYLVFLVRGKLETSTSDFLTGVGGAGRRSKRSSGSMIGKWAVAPFRTRRCCLVAFRQPLNCYECLSDTLLYARVREPEN